MSISIEFQNYEQLAQKLFPGSRLLRTWSLKGGISAEMTALELERPDGGTSKMIVRRPSARTLRRNPHAAQEEFELLRLTRSLDLATQTPYYLDQSGEIFSTPYLVIEYVEGQPEFAPADPADFTLQLAAQLAKIHSVDRSKLDLPSLSRPAKGFAEAVGELSPHIDASFDVEPIRATLAAAWPIEQRNAPALLHGDYWPGNLLWRDARLVAVIDWEDAALGDPLIDLAISRLDILWIFGAEAFESFTQSYTSLMRIDYANLPYWDLYAALRLARLAGLDLADWVAFFPPFGRPDITEQTLLMHYRRFVRQAFEKLEHR
jgi:aminoglycoside phosphotransferase (APT) family kinase protein